jgi:3-dehydroquinate synthase
VTRVVEVPLGERSYRVVISSTEGLGRLELPELSERGRRALLVTDHNVGPLWLGTVVSFLTGQGVQPEILELPAGEPTKNLAHLGKVYDACLRAGLRRDGWIVALGGGVIGDLTGLAAATWMRGVGWIQIPTSLLAMADSSVGGKTGIDFGGLKNVVGAFHQPRLVLTAPDFLRTLPDDEFANGLAEVIKSAVIGDPDLFGLLETQVEPIWKREPGVLAELIARSVEVKAGIVSGDEREQGARALLNLGHTLGHAIEAAGKFTRYRHGEAVAIGMVAACQLSVMHGIVGPEFRDRVERLLEHHRLPTRCPGIRWADLEPALRHDKKGGEGGLTYVLTGGIGHVTVHRQVSEASVREAAGYITG